MPGKLTRSGPVLYNREQRWFLQLRSVCRAVNAAFAQTPSLHSMILISKELHDSQHTSLADWVRCYQACIKIVCNGNPWLEKTLLTFQPARTCLEKVNCWAGATGPAVQLLASFQSITDLHLNFHKRGSDVHDVDNVDLQPMSMLPEFTKLCIEQADIFGLEAAANLSSLHLRDVHAECDCNCQFATSLMELHIFFSTVLYFHEDGIAACGALQSLLCSGGVGGASDPAEELSFIDGTHHRFPSALSALTSLTRLVLKYSDPNFALLLDRLANLTALEHLNVTAYQMDIPSSLSVLTNLKDLYLEFLVRHSDIAYEEECLPNVIWGFQLSCLISLERVRLCHPIGIADNWHGLSSLRSLKSIELLEMSSVNSYTATKVAMLAWQAV